MSFPTPRGLTRRGFMATGAAVAATPLLPRPGRADDMLPLAARSRVLDIDGRAVTVFGLEGPDGRQGLVLEPGQRFRTRLTNDLEIATLIHWHGQIPPNVQDGVPGIPMPLMQPGESRDYDFAARPGTYWMHAHVRMQELQLLAAPLIVRDAAEAAEDRQEVVMFLHDLAFATPEEVMATIFGGDAGADHDMQHGSMGGMSGMSGMGTSTGSGMAMGSGMGSGGGAAMDLNDYDWDAYLANDRTLSDPQVVQVERGGRIRLRVINGSSATVFWIDTGALAARLVAVDGHGVRPVPGQRVGLAMGQRADLLIDLPAGGGAWPVLALREGGRERTGLILATPGAAVPRIAAMAEAEAPAFDRDLAQELQLSAIDPLPARPVQRSQMLMLGGTMSPYRWTIDGRVWGDHQPVEARRGERVELGFHNMSGMAHPMHLHGHSFQVVEAGGRRFAGARRDTLHVPPMTAVTVALDAGEAARWMLHCHSMPHLQSGMMTEFAVGA